MAAATFVVGPHCVPATPRDVDAIFRCVNDAYAIEVGNTGVAFKTVNRYQRTSQVAEDVAGSVAAVAEGSAAEEPLLFAIIRAPNSPSHNRRFRVPLSIAGCIKLRVYTEADGRRLCEFGPFCVAPTNQNGGVGTILFKVAERFAVFYGATGLRITVVNHRTDVIAWYTKRGFAETGTVPFEGNFDPQEVTRPSHFIVFEKAVAAAGADDDAAADTKTHTIPAFQPPPLAENFTAATPIFQPKSAPHA